MHQDVVVLQGVYQLGLSRSAVAVRSDDALEAGMGVFVGFGVVYTLVFLREIAQPDSLAASLELYRFVKADSVRKNEFLRPCWRIDGVTDLLSVENTVGDKNGLRS